MTSDRIRQQAMVRHPINLIPRCPENIWGDCQYRTAFGGCENPIYHDGGTELCEENPVDK